MPLVSRKGILAIAAVIDVAINARSRPVSAKALAARHKLPPRHLEPVLQALVRDGILKASAGRTAATNSAREHRRITAEDILRAAGSAEEADEPPLPARRWSTTWCGRRWPKPSAASRPRSAASMSRTWRERAEALK